MTFALVITLLSGCAVLLAGVSLGLWQILSAPDQPNYPTSGPVKRLLMFWFMVALLCRSVEIFSLATEPDPALSTLGQAVSSFLLAALMITFLVDHCRHWLPARTHKRIQQLLAIARCRPSRELIGARTSAMAASTGAPCPAADVVANALVTLQLEGVNVIGPGEGPQVITGAD